MDNKTAKWGWKVVNCLLIKMQKRYRKWKKTASPNFSWILRQILKSIYLLSKVKNTRKHFKTFWEKISYV